MLLEIEPSEVGDAGVARKEAASLVHLSLSLPVSDNLCVTQASVVALIFPCLPLILASLSP